MCQIPCCYSVAAAEKTTVEQDYTWRAGPVDTAAFQLDTGMKLEDNKLK